MANWDKILIAILIVSIAYTGYNIIYHRGYTAASQEWQIKFDNQKKFREEQITQIEAYTKTTLEQMLIANRDVSRDIRNIHATIKGQPLTNIPCTPSESFVGVYNDMLKRANK